MRKSVKTLLVGAGAETIEPFGLPSGKRYVFDTCYFVNKELYSALCAFYRGRYCVAGPIRLGLDSSI